MPIPIQPRGYILHFNPIYCDIVLIPMIIWRVIQPSDLITDSFITRRHSNEGVDPGGPTLLYAVCDDVAEPISARWTGGTEDPRGDPDRLRIIHAPPWQGPVRMRRIRRRGRPTTRGTHKAMPQEREAPICRREPPPTEEDRGWGRSRARRRCAGRRC